jgi:hypothetical protein
MSVPQPPQGAFGGAARQEPQIPINSLTDVEYLLACFTTARGELLFRVKHRDNWIQLELLAQGILLAIAQGVQVGGVSAARPYPDVLGLSCAISLVLACLYYMEDNHIGYLSKYVGAISTAEAVISKRHLLIANWDISEQLRQYSRQVLPMRLVAQIIAFIVIPSGLSILWLTRAGSGTVLQYSELAVDSLFLLLITIFTVRAYRLRRKTGEAAPMSLLLSPDHVSQARPGESGDRAARWQLAKGFVALVFVALAFIVLLETTIILIR